MKKYLEIYNYYKNLIITKQLNNGDKMPSIRSACNLFDISKTTVQNAYFELQADGYILSTPKSGYYVSNINISNASDTENDETKTKVKYDFKSGDADKDSFDIALWQRYIKSALRQTDRLLSYSEAQGEYDLRRVLCEYIKDKRNVYTSPDRIVIGAGVQNLLGILCSLIKDKKTVSFPDSSFKQGMAIFNDYGYETHTRYKDADVIYVSPSHMTAYGDVMPIKRRLELVKYSEQKGSIVIEDDYDNDFVYQHKPTPALYTLSGAGNVVYMGSFSNVLLPGIRISFMVLTNELSNIYKNKKYLYAQTASKTEQIALCNYIRDGHINAQLRKIRRLYTNKAKKLYEELIKYIPTEKCCISENGLQVKLSTKFNKDINILNNEVINVNIESYKNNNLKLILTPSAIKSDEIKGAVKYLLQLLY